MQQHRARSFYCILIQYLSRLPLGVMRILGRSLARLLYATTQAKTIQHVHLNMAIALPHLDQNIREQLAKQAILNEVTSYFEFFHIWGSSTQKNLSRVHHIEGEKYFHDAIAAQKGVVLIIPHFGTWEILNAWLSKHSTLTIMYKPVKQPELDQFIKAARSREHANLVPTNDRGIREIFKALKAGGTTIILPDHSPDHGTDMSTYFGVPLYTSKLSAKLIQKTQAQSLLLYTLRNSEGGFDIHIEPLSDTFEQVDADQATLQLNEKLQNLIQRYPMHYHWSYKRFQAHPALHRLYDVPQAEALERIERLRNEYQYMNQDTNRATCSSTSS